MPEGNMQNKKLINRNYFLLIGLSLLSFLMLPDSLKSVENLSSNHFSNFKLKIALNDLLILLFSIICLIALPLIEKLLTSKYQKIDFKR
jgi:hypothetical protein